jgi:hypothetical protein
MAADVDVPREVPPAWVCGAYRVGHDMHFIQARLSTEDGPGVARIVKSVADDGTITFTDGTQCWNHDPARLRTIIDSCGADVMRGTHGVLRVPNANGAYCISVTEEPDPCHPETAEARPGESLIDELRRRGGVVRSGRSVLAEADRSQ